MKKQVEDFRPIILVLADDLLRRIAALFNEKDGKDNGKRMASKRELVLYLPLLASPPTTTARFNTMR